MGWASGSELAQDLWNKIKPLLREGSEKKARKAFIDKFEDYDCDTMDEVEWNLTAEAKE